MLEALVVVPAALWLLGMATAHTLGGFIHVLLVAAVVTFFILRGRRGGEPGTPGAVPPAPVAETPPEEAVDVEAILKEELAKKEKELQRKYEAQARELERELAKAQKEAKAREDAAAGEQKPPAQEPP